ncbi:interferon lambda receptor 1 [Syngnathoides biaculeatus]|uniref:interferon lambda receptor 1 n=1 Tax=Syngnathoides biaculeatus TaxID=300417 RepID=UPI002ADE5732|nr:interferon lambda receptor 1 [Syngnathoides biaculeatus]
MWSVAVIFLLLFCYACLSTGNGKVYFNSKNFFNVLHWDARESSHPDQKVFYSVQYKRYEDGETYQEKRECQNIIALNCNLTAETPSLPDVYYQARVYANGQVHGCSKRFKPIAHTTLGRANVSTGVTPTSLDIRAEVPLGPDGVSLADIIRRSKKGHVNTSIQYTFNLTSPEWAVQHHSSLSAHLVINLKSDQSKYCGYVVYKPLCEWGRPDSEKATFCVTLPGDPYKILPWPLTSAALLAVVVMSSFGVVRVYVKGRTNRRLPLSLELDTPRELPNIQHPPERNLVISSVMMEAQNEQIFVYNYARVRPKPNGARVGPLGNYSTQNIPCQPWLGTTGSSVERPNSQASSSQVSVVYSSVVPAVPTEQNKLPRVLVEDEEKISFLTQHTPCMDINSGGQMHLQTVRDANGELKLTSLAFQEESCPVGKPLLSELYESEEEASVLALLKRLDSSESSDSGCVEGTQNTPTLTDCNPTHLAPFGTYLSNNVPALVANPASGYKQNWMPLDPTPNKNQDYMRRTHPWTFPGEAEDREFNEYEGSGQIFLEDWVLQIQQ